MSIGKNECYYIYYSCSTMCILGIQVSCANVMNAFIMQYVIPGGTMRVPSPSDRIYACAHQFTMNLRYAFNNCERAHVRTY